MTVLKIITKKTPQKMDFEYLNSDEREVMTSFKIQRISL